MELEQILTNFVVGASSAWVAGIFGVRRGLEQVRRQRAFDLNVKWLESVIRTISKQDIAAKIFAFMSTVEQQLMTMKYGRE